MRVLIGYDGSEHSDAALDDLKRAGLARDSEALVVSVGDPVMSSPPIREAVAQAVASRRATAALKNVETHADRIIKEAEECASAAEDRLGWEFPEWNVKSRGAAGTPASELIDAANDWKADLVVVGSQGRSAIGRFFLGGVSKRVVTNSRCSVRISRSVERKKAYAPPKIIIGIDGSAAAEEAIDEVERRVWREGTQVRLAFALDQPSPVRVAARLPQAAGMIDDFNQSAANRVESMLNRATNKLKSIGLTVSVSIQKGDPKRILLKEARKWNADCIFVGTRNFKNSLERFRLGSVSTAVVTNAHCSVEVVRPT